MNPARGVTKDVWWPQPRHFVVPHARALPIVHPRTRVGQLPGALIATPAQPGLDVANVEQVPAPQNGDQIRVLWPYLFLASLIGGAAWALGSGLINRYVLPSRPRD